jgi:electron transfer flavoprotein alpha subunit
VSDVLVIAEHRQGKLRDVTLELVTVGARLGSVAVAVIARDPSGFADAVNVEGVAEVVGVQVDADEFEPDVFANAVAALIEERRPRIVLAPWSVDAMAYAPGVAARAGLGLATDAFELGQEDGELVATRTYYGGKVEAELGLGSEGSFVLIRPGAFEPAGGAGTAPLSQVTVAPTRSRARHVSYIEPETEGDVDIAQAKLVLAIGRGVGEKDNIPLFEELAERMGATLAVSRPLVDAGWVPSTRQVGQSGKTVKPAVYLAFGISGAIQHLAGMKGSDTIIAVNTDPEAAIFTVANYGAVADIFDVAEELEKLY